MSGNWYGLAHIYAQLVGDVRRFHSCKRGCFNHRVGMCDANLQFGGLIICKNFSSFMLLLGLMAIVTAIIVSDDIVVPDDMVVVCTLL